MINKKACYEDLMEKVMELANISGGWDEKAERFKPDVSEKIEEIERAAREALELPTSD